MSLFLSMAAFALAMSISPGPVNIVALSAGARYGVRASMRHVSGATIGFTALLIIDTCSKPKGNGQCNKEDQNIAPEQMCCDKLFTRDVVKDRQKKR